MIKVTTRGSFDKSQAFLQRMKNRDEFKVLSKYGSIGVTALANATPKESSKTANSWYYEIVNDRDISPFTGTTRTLKNQAVSRLRLLSSMAMAPVEAVMSKGLTTSTLLCVLYLTRSQPTCGGR